MTSSSHWQPPLEPADIVADMQALSEHIVADSRAPLRQVEIVNPPRWLIDIAIEHGFADADDWKGYRDAE
jgi:hypothetical protein